MAEYLLFGTERYALPILQPLADALQEAGHGVHAWFVDGAKDAALRGGVHAGEEGVQRGEERLALRLREDVLVAALPPRRRRPVDGEAELFGDRHERVLVGGMQPAAAEVERDAVADDHGMGAAADALAWAA